MKLSKIYIRCAGAVNRKLVLLPNYGSGINRVRAGCSAPSNDCRQASAEWPIGQDDRDYAVASIDIHIVDIAPAPFFAALRRLNDGMLCLGEVSPRVAIFGRIAAADMTAFQAHAQMHPGIAGLEAILTSLRRWLD